ncbi:hypothetical protein L211DRAFT_844547 [Terfezia boudieri ATCC MYA-4762]|uniref:Uncharacterized protein n=1 Tax=Terfezia boudieri ATCC MYA-4762 TaxID=1051890 RepID=A0A3N4MC11_9PEZI|nr:hypothetical protein L211DRAFT_844547 [Terfezia boudieri ATCC MYA-4762]
MEADEMMDDDLFADLYGDEEPKKQVSNTTKLSAAANGTVTTSAQPPAPSVSSASTVRRSEKASDLRSASGVPTTAAPQAHTSSNENNGQDNVDEDSYQGWDSQQNKGDASNGGNNDYQGYGGYEQEGDGYGDYSGGGSGNMVDVGGSTAIKEDGSTYLNMCLSLPTSLLKREEELELEWHWYKMLDWRGGSSWDVWEKYNIQPINKTRDFYRYSIATINTSTTLDEIDWRVGRSFFRCHLGLSAIA